jgi:glycosyltransferase involved in cell wall biosynthesis
MASFQATNKHLISRHFDKIASERPIWFKRNRIYHEQSIRVCKPFLNLDSRVLELGSSTGDLINALNPAVGVGVDLSAASISIAQAHYPRYQWIHADVEALPDLAAFDEPFDIIILSDLIAYLDDIEQTLVDLHRLTHSRTRVVVSFWNWLWRPVLRVAEVLNLKAPDLNIRENWLSPANVQNILELADYEVLQTLPGMLLPYSVPVLSPLVNSLAEVAVVRQFVLSNTIIARPNDLALPHPYSVSVIIPTRNEAGNVAAAVARTPMMGTHTELIFVDGNSTDGTVEKIQEQIAAHPELDIKFIPQLPPQSPDSNTPADLMLRLGKGDAVFKGFAAATGDILMILDSDLTVPPEELPKFYRLLATGKADMGNGTRFVYDQESGSMQELNRIGNVFFSKLFTWLLDQTITDTLCGTKVLFKHDYEAIVANRERFGNFDPFGDFDLLFGAAWLKHRIREVPVHYQARSYGISKVRTSLHGPLLGRMSLIALLHFKILPSPPERKPKAVRTAPNWVFGIAFLAVFWLSIRTLARLTGHKSSRRTE